MICQIRSKKRSQAKTRRLFPAGDTKTRSLKASVAEAHIHSNYCSAAGIKKKQKKTRQRHKQKDVLKVEGTRWSLLRKDSNSCFTQTLFSSFANSRIIVVSIKCAVFLLVATD